MDDVPAPVPAAPASHEQPVETKIIPDPGRRGRTPSGDEAWADAKLAHLRRDTYDPGDDPSPYSVPEHDEPGLHFRNNQEAVDYAKQDDREIREAARAYASDQAGYREQEHRAAVAAKMQWSEQEQQIVSAAQQRAQKLQSDTATFHAALEQARRELPQIEAANPALAAHIRASAQARAQELLAEHDMLQRVDHAARQTLAQKPTDADRLKLERRHPELTTDPNFKANAIAWAEREHGVLPEEAVNHRDLGTVSRYLDGYKAHLRDQRSRDFDRYIQKRSRDMGVNSRAGNQGVAGGEKGLLDYLRAGKATPQESESAALAYLMASRTRARERGRGRL